MQKPKLVYTTYIRSTPKDVWAAITKPEFTAQYWGKMTNVSDWKRGSKWEHHNPRTKSGSPAKFWNPRRPNASCCPGPIRTTSKTNRV